MKYFSVGNKSDSLSFYVWADNPQHAVRKVEDLYGPIAPQQQRVTPILAESIPEGEYVIDEPDMEKEAREDGTET